MASIQSVIEIIFNATDNASGAINSLAGGLGKLDAGIQTIAAPFASLADSLIAAEAAALAFGAAMTVVAVKQAGEFQQSFQFTTTLFETGAENIANFRQGILDYASGSTQSLASINTALQTAIGSGVDYADSLKVLAEAERLAVAQGGELDATTGLLVGTLNGYGLEMDQAAKLSDQFSVTIRDGKISVGELASQLANITPIAASAGVGFEQIGAALAVLTAQGFQAGPAVTGVKQIIEGLIKPTSAAAEYAASLGLEFNAAALQSKGLEGVLKEVQIATGGNVDSMAKLFTTTEGLGAALALSGVGAEAFAQELQAMAEASGTTQAAFEKMSGTLGQTATRIDNALKVAFVNFGTPLLDEVGTVGKGIAGIFTELGNSFKDGGPLRDLTAGLETWGADFGRLVGTIAQNLPEALGNLDFSGLLNSLDGLGDEVGNLFESFFGEIDLTTVDGLTKALQTVMNTFEALTITVTAIIAELNPLFAMIGEVVRGFNDLDKASQVEFGSFLGQMKLIVDAGTGVGLALIAIGRAGLDMKDAMDVAFGSVTVAVNSLQTGLGVMALGLTKIWETALEGSLALYELNPFADAAVIADTKAKIADVQKFADSLAGGIEKNAEELRAGAEKAGQGLLNMATSSDTARAKLDESEKAIRGAGQAAKDAGGDFGQLSNEIDAALNAVDKTVKQFGSLKIDAPTIDVGDPPFGINLDNVFDGIGSLDIQGVDPFVDAIEGLTAFGKAAEEAAFGTKEFVTQGTELDTALKKNAGQLEWTGVQFEAVEPKIRNVYDGFGNLINTVTDLEPVVKKTGGGLSILGDSSGKAADKTKDAKDQLDALTKGGKLTVDQLTEITKAANDFEVKMEEIASNERIKTIEAFVSLNTAKLETDMERVKSAFASIDNSISSTSDLLNSLFGNLTSTDDPFKELKIEEQIDLENKRRQDQLDIQKKLIEAEIARTEAQTAALNRGDALIRVEGDGLKPELEAFMWKILETIRVRANAEFADYLLGVGVP